MRPHTKKQPQSEEGAKRLGDCVQHHDSAPGHDVSTKILPEPKPLCDVHRGKDPDQEP